MSKIIQTSVMNSQSFNQAAEKSVLEGLEAYALYAKQLGIASDNQGHLQLTKQLKASNENARTVLEIVHRDFML